MSMCASFVLCMCLLVALSCDRSNAQTTTWKGATTGSSSWNVPTNWDNGVPDVNYTAIIGAVTGTITVSIPVTTGSITFSGSGTLVFVEPVQLTGVLNITGTGTAEFRSSSSLAQLALTGGTTSAAGPKIFVTGASTHVNVTQSVVWTGNNCQTGATGNPVVGGHLNLLPSCRSIVSSGGFIQYILRITIHNYGYVEYGPVDDGLELSTAGQFRNEPGGVFNVTGNAAGNAAFSTSLAQQDPNAFSNFGTIDINLPTSSNSFRVTARFDNSGVVNVNSGLLEMRGNGLHSGTFNHAPNAFIRFTAGTHTLSPSSVVSAGTGVIFSGADVTVQGTFAPSFFQQLDGATIFQIPYTTSSALTVTGGSLVFQTSASLLSSVTVPTSSKLDFRGGSSTVGTIIISATGSGGGLYVTGAATVVNVIGEFWWVANSQVTTTTLVSTTGGRLNLMPSCQSYFRGTGVQTLGYVTLSNYGYAEYSSLNNGISLSNSAAFRNELGGVFNVQTESSTDISFSSSQTALTFTNLGTLNINLPSTAASFKISSKFDNGGVVNVNLGALEMRGGGNHAGTFNHNPGAAVRFAVGTFVLEAPSVVGAGDGIVFNGATTTVAGTFLPQTFQHNTTSTRTTFTTPFNNIASGAMISLSAGTLTFVAPAFVHSLTLLGSSKIDFQGAGSVVRNLDLSGTSGSLGVTGVAASVNVSDTFRWSGTNNIITSTAPAVGGGTLTLLPSCNSVISGAGTSQILNYVTVRNYGTLSYVPLGNGVTLSDYATFRNERGGVFNASSSTATDTLFSVANATQYFYNAGLLTVNLPSSFNLKINARFQNEGTGVVQVNNGSLELRQTSSSSHLGVFNHTSPGAYIKLIGGTHTFLPASYIHAGNGLIFAGATSTIQGYFGPTSFEHVSGSTSFDLTVASLYLCTVTVAGGSLNILPSVASSTVTSIGVSGGTVTFAKEAVINHLALSGTGVARFQSTTCATSLELNGGATLSIDPGVQVNVRKRFDWTGSGASKITSVGPNSTGELNLLPSCRSVFNSTGTTQFVSYVQLRNYGYLDYSPGSNGMTLVNGAIFRNQPGGIFNVTRSVSDTYVHGAATAPFYNYGDMVLNIPTSLRVFRMQAPFFNYGRLDVGEGHWISNSTATQVTGLISLKTGGFFELTGTNTNLVMQGGVLDGTGELQGTLIQTGGVVRPGGPELIGLLTINSWDMQPGGNVEIEAASTTTYDTVHVRNTGTLQGQLTFKGINTFTPVPAIYSGVIDFSASLAGSFDRTSSASVTMSVSVSSTQVHVTVTSTTPAFVCSGCQNGDCVASGICVCRDGWAGANCNTPFCPSGCQAGSCVGPNQCQCSSISVGFTCDSVAPRACMTGVWCFSGCTDPSALNYDPSALHDDGSCLYKCQNSTCVTPPPNFCTGNIATAYSPAGYCADLISCDYYFVTTDCSMSTQTCVAGTCVNTTATSATTAAAATTAMATTAVTTAATTTGAATTAIVTTAPLTTATGTATTAVQTTSSRTTSATSATATGSTGVPLVTVGTTAISQTSEASGDNIGRSSSDSSSVALPVGVAVGGALLLMACCAAIVFLVMRRKRQNQEEVDLHSISLNNFEGNVTASPKPAQPVYQPINVSTHSIVKEKPSVSVETATSGSSVATKSSSSSSNVMEAWQGDIDFNEITVGEKIGAGAFGVVYAGKWRGTKVALKVMSAALSEQSRAEFQHEAAIMKNLHPHPNVVQFLGICVTADGSLCLVTQFCKEGSLYNLLRSNRNIEAESYIRIIKDITAGMVHLAAEKVVHRDLAARNVLLSDNFEAKVADFGMSRVAVTDVSATTSEVGPIKYMSPESLLQREYSEKSDVWAWAITLWEIYTRTNPYPEWTAMETATRVCQMSAPYVLPPPDNMSEEVTKLYLSCLSFFPGDRPTFQQISLQLDSIQVFFKAS